MLGLLFLAAIIGCLYIIPQPETRVIMIQVQQVVIEAQPLPTARVHKNGLVPALAEPDDQPGRVIDIIA